ncbi:MAG: hypothetical protein HKN47_14325 [Pirellulaceae bacterium]|nr:hypothetical protein [Pirellulaceae bacterium]
MSDSNPYASPENLVPENLSPVDPDRTVAPPHDPIAGGYPQEYPRKPTHALALAASAVGGALAMLFGLSMFLVNLFLLPGGGNQLAFHATTTAPVIIGLFTLIHAYHLARSPQWVRLWPQGIEIEAKQLTRLSWDQIQNVAVDEALGGQTKLLRLKDGDDKVIQTISGVDRFDDLVKQVKSFVSPLEQTTESKTATAVHRKRGRWRAIGFASIGLLLVAGTGFMIYDGRWKQYAADQMSKSSLLGTGVVDQRKVAPNGRTKRLYVAVTGEDGSVETHNFEVDELMYGAAVEGGEIPVRYVPSDPRIAELPQGQIKASGFMETAVGSYLLAGGLGLIGVFLLANAVLAWKGYDIKAEKGKMRLVPIGE